MELPEQEFEAVYRAYASLVCRYLWRLGCPPQDAEDIVQDTFVTALLHIDSWRGEGKLSTWLCQIAKNTWLTALRRQKRVAPLPSDPAGTDDHSCEWLDLVEKLEEPYRTVFLKRALGDCPYSTLAREYGKSESWARVTFHRARMRILQMLSEEEKNHG